MTTRARKDLARQALEKSVEVRDEHGYDFRSPLCVYEICARAGVTVQFADDINMEGVYVALNTPTIIVSALRPLSRRAFTCAHELGHHVFEHGSTIDELRSEAEQNTLNPNEFLVDAFAGFLLMPAQAIKRAFSSRELDAATATAEQMYQVACGFGVGYDTLLGHLQYSLGMVSRARAEVLRKSTLPQIRERILGEATKAPLVIADMHHAMGTIDAEVGTLVLLPPDVVAESDQVELVRRTASGTLYRTIRPGLVRVAVPGSDWGIVVRVSRFQYAGLARYRHLEETDGE
jgi:Zn-dependent peptidase ImmA (M78 family)